MSRRAPHLKLVPTTETPLDLSSVYRAYSAYVAAIVFRLLGRDDEVDDIIQDVFLSAARGLDALRDPGAAKAWLATAAVRLSLRRLRRRRLRGFLGLDSVTENQIASIAVDPADRVLVARVYALLDELPARERVAWILHHVEGETIPAVATLCGCSPATTKRCIAAAQSYLEERLS